MSNGASGGCWIPGQLLQPLPFKANKSSWRFHLWFCSKPYPQQDILGLAGRQCQTALSPQPPAPGSNMEVTSSRKIVLFQSSTLVKHENSNPDFSLHFMHSCGTVASQRKMWDHFNDNLEISCWSIAQTTTLCSFNLLKIFLDKHSVKILGVGSIISSKMIFRFLVESSETEVQQISLHNVKVEKVRDFGHLVAKTQQCFTNESHEKFTKFQLLLLCHHYP